MNTTSLSACSLAMTAHEVVGEVRLKEVRVYKHVKWALLLNPGHLEIAAFVQKQKYLPTYFKLDKRFGSSNCTNY